MRLLMLLEHPHHTPLALNWNLSLLENNTPLEALLRGNHYSLVLFELLSPELEMKSLPLTILIAAYPLVESSSFFDIPAIWLFHINRYVTCWLHSLKILAPLTSPLNSYHISGELQSPHGWFIQYIGFQTSTAFSSTQVYTQPHSRKCPIFNVTKLSISSLIFQLACWTIPNLTVLQHDWHLRYSGFLLLPYSSIPILSLFLSQLSKNSSSVYSWQHPKHPYHAPCHCHTWM